MFHPEIQNALNQQMNDNFTSWYFYRAAAAYCDEINLRGMGKWLRERAGKKLRQATKVSDFLLARRGHVDHRPIHPPEADWDSPLGLLERAHEVERRLGDSVGQTMTLALSSGDHSAHDFLESFAREQAEAESKLERVAERLKLVGDVPTGLFLFDQAPA